MDTYISREAIIEELEEEIAMGDEFDEKDVLINKGLKIALKDIKRQPAADVQPVDRWISVEDRLPEVDKQVLVYIKKPDDNHDNVEKAHLSDKSDDEYPYWVFENGRFYSTRFRYATHWQPVPKPPKDGDIE